MSRTALFPVSVVIPARNEQSSIGQLLDSLSVQTYPPREVLVVDAGSLDQTASIVRAHATKASFPIVLIQAGPAFPGRARNLGIDRATSPFVALLDAGVRINADWLERLVEPLLKDPSLEVVYGNYEPTLDTVFQKAEAVTYIDPRRTIEGATVRAPSVASLLLRKDVWQALGGFPEGLRAAEDLIFKEQIASRHCRSAWAPGAVIQWELPTTVRALFRKFADYSCFSLHAGLFDRWHRGVLGQYVLLSVAALVGLLVSGKVWVGAVVVPLFFLARASKQLARKPELVGHGTDLLLVPPLVVFVQMVIDVAMFAGLIAWVMDRTRHVTGPEPTRR